MHKGATDFGGELDPEIPSLLRFQNKRLRSRAVGDIAVNFELPGVDYGVFHLEAYACFLFCLGTMLYVILAQGFQALCLDFVLEFVVGLHVEDIEGGLALADPLGQKLERNIRDGVSFEDHLQRLRLRVERKTLLRAFENVEIDFDLAILIDRVGNRDFLHNRDSRGGLQLNGCSEYIRFDGKAQVVDPDIMSTAALENDLEAQIGNRGLIQRLKRQLLPGREFVVVAEEVGGEHFHREESLGTILDVLDIRCELFLIDLLDLLHHSDTSVGENGVLL